jgi:hypothetical protein
MTKLNKIVKLEEVLTPVETDVVIEEQKVVSPTFVVTRGGLRVSDFEYPSQTDPVAISEKNFWKRVVQKYPDGTRIEIVQFDKKKHRVY